MLYTKNDNYELHLGKMQDVLPTLLSDSIDAIITDPPYELNFMNKGWDNSGVAFQVDTWKHCLRVLKPGGYLLAFGGTRTYHRIACAIEDAGFEIRDCIMWLYGSGFPKSMNIGLAIDKHNGIESPVIGQNEQILQKQAKDLREGKRTIVDSYNAGASDRNTGFVNVSADIKQAQNEWSGWGTALKPAYEPIIVARKPFSGSLVDNIIEYRVGGLNIDECRVPHNEDCKLMKKQESINSIIKQSGRYEDTLELKPEGRFPANVIHDGSDEATSGMPNTKGNNPQELGEYGYCWEGARDDKQMSRGYDDEGSASRYFYCAKASRRDRDEGCEQLDNTFNACSNQAIAEFKRGNSEFSDENNSTFNKVYIGKNTHPTVKPVALMQYLIRLVCPKGSIILDPFNGSGSTGKAAMYENNDRNAHYYYIGVEMTEEYLPISKARIDYAITNEISLDVIGDESEATNNKPKQKIKVELW